ncbi:MULTISPECIES: hypothetical protein [Paenibacillus]|jgi:hypothetical protein|uniref:Uncharacterized protein n=2 Tax=Paenibacillus TaxID=44249 RepID=A0ABX2Z6E4_PAEPO|nr:MULTISPECIES: hypothetical protein [Paenibacillus]AIW41143.1 hypothetical protein X809_34775 [Paenibacillus polymyxa CR1]MDR6777240.1 hypothetical protein [Paenibacillus peoriae]ODA06263.1 hypothetical protein A7312_15275 [Paenibacillus polymyxa]OME66176.1 hypothetical protein BK119_22725 [Paenibacillus peoriae]OMF35018.1 hypothetical protein BK134_07220 [Paenibacillus peoriae]
MLNPKKLEMAYRRYSKNFVDGIKFEEIKNEYEECQSEIINIVDLNAVEKDHILLIDLDSVFSYYLSKWKYDVLINGGNRVEELKKMQMVVFYQCMGQDLYKIRYPGMMPEYSFREVITALIHFTMFGWEKEENILFDFIENNLGSNILEANEWNKHTWFLLELYLQYRNKTIAGTSQYLHIAVKEKFKEAGLRYDLIPEDLDVYKGVLEQWKTRDSEVINRLIGEMSLYHSMLASEIGESMEFGDFRYGFYPYEILFLLYVRNKLSLPVFNHFDDVLMNTPEAKMEIGDHESYPEWDTLLRLIDNFYRKNYPEYIPNKHGELFQ